MTPPPLASAQVETTLLVLKLAFFVVLYVFIWRIVRSAARDLRLPQESMILAPQQVAGLEPLAAGSCFGSFFFFFFFVFFVLWLLCVEGYVS